MVRDARKSGLLTMRARESAATHDVPHPEERAFARVSKDERHILMVRDARKSGLLTMRAP
jgi:hypothetical protein